MIKVNFTLHFGGKMSGKISRIECSFLNILNVALIWPFRSFNRPAVYLMIIFGGTAMFRVVTGPCKITLG